MSKITEYLEKRLTDWDNIANSLNIKGDSEKTNSNIQVSAKIAVEYAKILKDIKKIESDG